MVASASFESNDGTTDMPHHLVTMIESNLEEEQYDGALDLLDQLRSPHYMPPPAQIRQLVYMALLPVSLVVKRQTEQLSSVSPSKAARRIRAPTLPPAEAIYRARRLLSSFSVTNTPEQLFRALPGYHVSVPLSALDGDDIYSMIGKAALSILECKDCWSFLVEEFTHRRLSAFASPKKGKGRRASARHIVDEEEVCRAESEEGPRVVGRESWDVLEWLVDILERNQEERQEDGTPPFAPLLLTQIPPPKTNSMSRWETDAPLNIVFYCLEQAEERRVRVGLRLMTLLANLAAAGQIDGGIFTSAVVSRLAAKPAGLFSRLLAGLPASMSIARFKVSLCRKLLAGSRQANKAPRPKPQARARPRTTNVSRAASTNTDSSKQPEPDSTAPRSEPLPLPEVSDLLQLATQTGYDKQIVSTEDACYRVKFELLSSFAYLQGQISTEDTPWALALADGSVQRTIDAAFGRDQAGRRYREVLACILRVAP